MHGRRGQRLLIGHPHAAEDDDDHGEDEEHAARHVDEDVGVVFLLLRTHCLMRREEVTRTHTHNTHIRFTSKIIIFSFFFFIT